MTTERDPTAKWITRFAILSVIWFLCSVVWDVAHAETKVDRVAQYVRHFHRNLDPKFTERVIRRYVPLIYRHAGEELDPLLLATTLAVESSFRPEAVGRAGELGMSQVNPRAWPRFQGKLENANQQIKAGAYILKYCKKFCGEESLAIFSCWHSSKRCTPGKRAKHKEEVYRDAVERFGEKEPPGPPTKEQKAAAPAVDSTS
jgi:soluble lytic murein transglycosylase-like protein